MEQARELERKRERSAAFRRARTCSRCLRAGVDYDSYQTALRIQWQFTQRGEARCIFCTHVPTPGRALPEWLAPFPVYTPVQIAPRRPGVVARRLRPMPALAATPTWQARVDAVNGLTVSNPACYFDPDTEAPTPRRRTAAAPETRTYLGLSLPPRSAPTTMGSDTEDDDEDLFGSDEETTGYGAPTSSVTAELLQIARLPAEKSTYPGP